MKMRIPLLTVALLPLLLLLITNTAAQIVVDSDGNEVQPGHTYYIVSATWGAGHGSVKASPTDNVDACEYDVRFIGDEANITECDNYFSDMAVSFSSLRPSLFSRIEVNAPTQISFPNLGQRCARNSNSWILEDDGRLRTLRIDERAPRNQWFQFNRQRCYDRRRCPSVYTLSSCESICTSFPLCPAGTPLPACRYLTMTNNGGQEFTDDESRASQLALTSGFHFGSGRMSRREAKIVSSFLSA